MAIDAGLFFVVSRANKSTPCDKYCSQANQYQTDPEVTGHFFIQNQPRRKCEKHPVEAFEGVQIAQIEVMQER
jgi:hypothetical protein